MGRLVEGRWVDSIDQVDHDDGEYDRVETTFRNQIKKDGSYPPETGRYHLYVSHACPWCHRTTILRVLRGLEDVVTIDILDPVRRGEGWEFNPTVAGCTEDSLFNYDYLRDIYTETDPTFTGRPTAPVLFDRKNSTIVNNESSDIMRMFDTVLGDAAGNEVNLYPKKHKKSVDQIIKDIYDPINNGVTQAGFAETQEAYDRAVSDLFDSLSYWDKVLSNQRYLAGQILTEADIAMFTTIYRFDEGYHTNFACNRNYIVDYPNLWDYLREIYQLPGINATCNMDHVKANFYQSTGHRNPSGIIPIGPDPEFKQPHGRDYLPGGPPKGLEY